MILTTGGRAMGATSTRSSPFPSATASASSIGSTPNCSPVSEITRTGLMRIMRLTRTRRSRSFVLSGTPPGSRFSRCRVQGARCGPWRGQSDHLAPGTLYRAPTKQNTPAMRGVLSTTRGRTTQAFRQEPCRPAVARGGGPARPPLSTQRLNRSADPVKPTLELLYRVKQPVERLHHEQHRLQVVDFERLRHHLVQAEGAVLAPPAQRGGRLGLG